MIRIWGSGIRQLVVCSGGIDQIIEIAEFSNRHRLVKRMAVQIAPFRRGGLAVQYGFRLALDRQHIVLQFYDGAGENAGFCRFDLFH